MAFERIEKEKERERKRGEGMKIARGKPVEDEIRQI